MIKNTIHTPGRIRYYENGEANSYALLEVDADDRWLLTMLHNGTDATERQIANMRRLVACWNACDGIPTENLERAEGDTAPVFALLMATTAQRDELLVCLKWMVGLYEQRFLDEGKLVSGAEYCASLNAIAKATGEEG